MSESYNNYFKSKVNCLVKFNGKKIVSNFGNDDILSKELDKNSKSEIIKPNNQNESICKNIQFPCEKSFESTNSDSKTFINLKFY